jgi:SAM-dependent methyltransferase
LTHQTSAAFSAEPKAPRHFEDTASGGYDPAFFERLARIEDEHFWFRARNRLIFRLATKIASELPPGYLVLEVGCGTGNVLRVLRKACPNGVVVGLELWFDGLRYAQKRSAGLLVQGDVRNFPFRKPFSLVGMFDVLEHVKEERETLASVWESLAPGGRLLLTVPAHQFLWSYFDEAAHHCRRYSARDLRERLTEAGFHLEFVSQFMAVIFPMIWLIRKLRGLLGRADSATMHDQTTDEFKIVPIFNSVLTALLTLEAGWVARGHCLPFGTSLIVIARKPPLDQGPGCEV